MRKLLGITVLAALAVAVLYAGVPRPAGKLTAKLADGRTISLSDYKGKVVAVEIINTTCVHCQRSAMALEAVYRELNSKGFQVIGVATNQPTPAVLNEFRQKFNITFPVGSGDHLEVVSFIELSPVMNFYVPQILFVDKKGTVRGHYQATDAFIANNEEANVREMATKLLAE